MNIYDIGVSRMHTMMINIYTFMYKETFIHFGKHVKPHICNAALFPSSKIGQQKTVNMLLQYLNVVIVVSLQKRITLSVQRV